MKIITFSRDFHQNVNFMLFYNFPRRVMENTLGFCNPSSAFWPQTKQPRGCLVFYPQNVIWGDFNENGALLVEFHENGGI